MTNTLPNLVVIICPDDPHYATQTLLHSIYLGEIPFHPFLQIGRFLDKDEARARHEITRQVIHGYATAMAAYTDQGFSKEMVRWMKEGADAELALQTRSFKNEDCVSPWSIGKRPVLTGPDGTKVAL